MRRHSTLSTILIATVTVATIIGCAHQFNAAATPAIASSNAAANDAFGKARGAFDKGSLDAAEAAFRRFTQQYPNDVLTLLARVYLGRIALQRGQLAVAGKHLAPVVEASETTTDPAKAQEQVKALARYHLGITQVRQGAYAKGRQLLRPFLAQANDETLPALLVALGKACVALRDHSAAVSHLGRLHALTDRPTEKLWARETLGRVINRQLSSTSLRELFRSSDSPSLVKALAAERLIALELAAGHTAQANQLRAQSSDLRARYGLERGAAAGSVSSGPIGLLLPFSGRYRSAGRLALGGCVFAAGSFLKSTSGALLIRDSGTDPARQARELIEEHGVIALVGGLGGQGAADIARIATAAAVPFLTLDSRATPGPTSTTLRLLPTNKQRAAVLARHAATIRRGARLAIVAPDNAFGRTMSKAFADEARSRGAVVVTQLSYPGSTKSFAPQAALLAKKTFDGLFVPDSARRLALLAPALALEGLWSVPPGKKPPKGRAIRIFATADGATAALVSNARRYLDGALLAPGFFPDELAPGSGPIVKTFVQARGKPPGLVAAFAADAVTALRSQIERGANNRAALLAALRKRATVGLTGQLQFSANGFRAHPPLLYRLSRNGIHLVH